VTRSEYSDRPTDVMKTHEPSQDPQAAWLAASMLALRAEPKIEQVAAANRHQLRNFNPNRPPPSRWQG